MLFWHGEATERVCPINFYTNSSDINKDKEHEATCEYKSMYLAVQTRVIACNGKSTMEPGAGDQGPCLLRGMPGRYFVPEYV
jgi:hypothetical protein